MASMDGSFPIVEEIVPRNPDIRYDFSKLPETDLEIFKSAMAEADLRELKAKYYLPNHIELSLAGWDVVQVHHPRYCAFYAYPFHVGYTFPILTLAKGFYRYYGIFLAQPALYVYKLLRMLTKFAELVGIELSL